MSTTPPGGPSDTEALRSDLERKVEDLEKRLDDVERRLGERTRLLREGRPGSDDEGERPAAKPDPPAG
jgi:hypothetical protein